MFDVGLRRNLLFAGGALTLLGVLAAVRMLVAYSALGHPIPWTDALGSGLADWYLWAVPLPAMFVLARRVPFTRARLPFAVLVHAAAAAACSFAQLAAFAGWSAFIRTWRFGADSFLAELKSGFAIKFSGGVLVYFAFVIGWQALHAARRAAALARSLADARLCALEAQLQPHFLFNTLNTIAHLVRHDPDGAERAVLDLGGLLRAALQQDGAHEVTVQHELDLLDRYLRIQHVRFGERLAVSTEVDPRVQDALLPPLLLQPLVENAIRHGIGDRSRGGSLRISATARGDRLELRVLDDGAGPGDAAGTGRASGFGLSSTRERLRLLYGDAQSVHAVARAGGGTAIVIELPLRSAAVTT